MYCVLLSWPVLRALLAVFFVFVAASATVGADKKASVTVWGGLVAPASVRDIDSENNKFETYIKPAVNVLEIKEKSWISLYALMALLRDDEKLDYNSKSRFALGFELKHKLTRSIRLSFGARYALEHLFYSGMDREGPVLTADMSLYRVLRPQWLANFNAERGQLILSGWANFRYPNSLETSEKRNFLLQGAIKASLKHPIGNGPISVAPFSGIVVKADGKRRPWNNTVEPAIGLEFKASIGKGGELSLGAKTSIQIRYLDGDKASGTVGYLAWYKRF